MVYVTQSHHWDFWTATCGLISHKGIKQIFTELGLDLNNGWEAESIKITIVFKQIGKGRCKQVTVNITPPNTCDLKNRSQDDVVRKLLKDWGIAVK